MRNARLDNSQAGIKISQRNINNLGYADDTTLTAESEEELKCLLMKVKEENEKAGLKLNIQKTMAYSPITSWHMRREKWKQWQVLFSWAPKSLWILTVAVKLKDTCSFEEKLKAETLLCQQIPPSQNYGFSSSHV